jgi:D-aminopeptidase
MVNNDHMSALFSAAAEAVEEAIVNALLAATDMSARGSRAVAIGSERLLSALREVGWKPDSQNR